MERPMKAEGNTAPETMQMKAEGSTALDTIQRQHGRILNPLLREIPLRASEPLLLADGPIERLYFPLQGMISLLIPLRTGSSVEVATVGSSGVVGAAAAFGQDRSSVDAVVQIAGRAAVIEASTVRQIAREHPSLLSALFKYEEFNGFQAQQGAACNAKHLLEARLARWLLRCADITGCTEIRLTQEFLAEMLGTRRTSVTLAAQHLEAAGLVVCQRKRIRILEAERLAAAACECYARIKAAEMRLAAAGEDTRAGAA
jgi:CRP-like cAMP-binding protein